MVQIIKDGAVLGVTEQPNFITVLSNGAYGLCDEAEATGIVYKGKVYGLLGKHDGALESVALSFVDGGRLEMEQAAVQGIMFVTLAESGAVDDATAGEHAEMFGEWSYPVQYRSGQIRRYTDGKLYRCLQDHTSQEDWTPDAAGSLWVAIADPAEEWPQWSQPIGAVDTYAAGDKVTHADKHWISGIDNNVWEPGIYGWEEESE